MAQRPLNVTGGRARHIGARIPNNQAEWFEQVVTQCGGNRSEALRLLFEIAARHKEELLVAS